MKKAAKLLGVSYGTLYGRYRETYGCLKHPYRWVYDSHVHRSLSYVAHFYRGPPGSYMVSRMREMWPGNGDEQNDLLNLVQRNRISMVSKANHLSIHESLSNETFISATKRWSEWSKLNGHDARRGYVGTVGSSQKFPAKNDEQSRCRQSSETSSKWSSATSATQNAITIIGAFEFTTFIITKRHSVITHAGDNCCAINKFSYRSFQISWFVL